MTRGLALLVLVDIYSTWDVLFSVNIVRGACYKTFDVSYKKNSTLHIFKKVPSSPTWRTDSSIVQPVLKKHSMYRICSKRKAALGEQF